MEEAKKENTGEFPALLQSPIVAATLVFVLFFIIGIYMDKIIGAFVLALFLGYLGWRYQKIRMAFPTDYSKKTGMSVEDIKRDNRFAFLEYNKYKDWSPDIVFLIMAILGLVIVILSKSVLFVSLVAAITTAVQMAIVEPRIKQVREILANTQAVHPAQPAV